MKKFILFSKIGGEKGFLVSFFPKFMKNTRESAGLKDEHSKNDILNFSLCGFNVSAVGI